MGGVRAAMRPMFGRGKWRLVRGDTVQITAGRDAGATGVVARVIRDPRRPAVVVEGRNLSKKHIKRTEDNPGGVITVETPIHYSNVRLLDPVTKVPVRVGWRYLEDGSKVRVTKGSRASGSVVPRPALLAQRRAPRPLPGPADTPVAVAQRVTRGEADLPSALAELANFGGRGGGAGQEQRRTFCSGGGGSSASSPSSHAWPPRSGRAWVGFAAGGVTARWW